GVQIALDDYGTGYASIGYLRQPVFDIVKTDKSFLTEPAGHNQVLLEAVLGLCQRLGLDVVVEGVANEAGLRVATGAEAEYGQGFHYAAALPLSDAARWRLSMKNRWDEGNPR